MKSSFRFNGQEIVVENVIAASDEFNAGVFSSLQTIFGQDKIFEMRPVENFSNPEQTETIFNGVVTGQFESEAPVAVHVYSNEVLVMTAAGFISFRK